jgi:hypothetical protein
MLLISAVLVGLWVMHGMTGATDTGCHGAPMPLPAPGATTTTPITHDNVSTATRHDASDGGAPPVATLTMDQMRHGELCLSGQPPNPGRDALALLALLILIVCGPTCGPCEPLWLRPVSPGRRRAPPGPDATRLLTLVCLSRT